MKAYTGVGSREAPESALRLLERLGATLAARGFVLRSGGALGADKAFEDGCLSVEEGVAEIFLPWSGYNDHTRTSHKGMCILPSDIHISFEKRTDEICREIHPVWDAVNKDGDPILKQGAKKMHMRNCHQVLGRFLDDPVKFLVCWAKTDRSGNIKGGTATAWNLAKKHKIPRFNVSLEADRLRIEKFCEEEQP